LGVFLYISGFYNRNAFIGAGLSAENHP